jgi:serine/threonine protein kinase
MPGLPDESLIHRLLLGKLAPQEADQLCLELADDTRLTELGRLPAPDDSLLTVLRLQKGLAPEALSPRLERLLGSVRQRLAASPDETAQAPPLPPSAETLTLPGIPRELGSFILLGILGAGGMGVVYHAHDVQLDRRVALKVIRAELAARPEVRERFLREARHAATVEHPNVGDPPGRRDRGRSVSDHAVLHGEMLEARLVRVGAGQPPGRRFGSAETAEGLAGAHDRGLVHRDIKPSNLWLQALDGGGFRVVILDFGLARLQTQQSTFTQTGALLGTPAYMAPEQARGKTVDHRADLFSLGCVLYQMATGRRPFTGADTFAVLSSLATDSPPPPSAINPAVPAALSELIAQMLEKAPARRPASAAAVSDRLAAIDRERTEIVPVRPRCDPCQSVERTDFPPNADRTRPAETNASNTDRVGCSCRGHRPRRGPGRRLAARLEPPRSGAHDG